MKEQKIIHIVSSASAECLLGMAFRKMGLKDEVIHLPVDFSSSYLPQNFSDEELCLAACSSDSVLEHPAKWMRRKYETLKTFVGTDFTSYYRVVVWHGWAACDLLLLYLMSVLSNGNLYRVDLVESMQKKGKATAGFYDLCEQEIISNNLTANIKPVSDAEQKEYQALWHKWSRAKVRYRWSDFRDGVLKGYPEDFMDAAILENAKQEMNFMKIVALVMEKFSNLAKGSYVVEQRILELLLERKVKIRVGTQTQE